MFVGLYLQCLVSKQCASKARSCQKNPRSNYLLLNTPHTNQICQHCNENFQQIGYLALIFDLAQQSNCALSALHCIEVIKEKKTIAL